MRLPVPAATAIVSLALLKLAVDGAVLRVLFSGDTIIAEEHRGDVALARAWGRFALSLIDRCAQEPLYWFLIS